jgi:uncharacterized Zn finger protein
MDRVPVPCPICGNERATTLVLLAEGPLVGRMGCDECGHVWTEMKERYARG